MQKIFAEILGCKGCDNCWGKATRPSPVSLRTTGKVKVMVITEQRPTQKEKETQLEDELKCVKENRLSPSNVIDSINNLFSHRFLNDFDAKEKVFRKFYWTHFIKCPGNLRNSKLDSKRKLDLDACPSYWLPKEIRILDPQLIVSFGAYAGKWILKTASLITEDSKWIDWIWENEIIQTVKGKWVMPKAKLEGKERNIVLMFHPSGQNILGRKINEKIGALVKQSGELSKILSES